MPYRLTMYPDDYPLFLLGLPRASPLPSFFTLPIMQYIQINKTNKTPPNTQKLISKNRILFWLRCNKSKARCDLLPGKMEKIQLST